MVSLHPAMCMHRVCVHHKPVSTCTMRACTVPPRIFTHTVYVHHDPASMCPPCACTMPMHACTMHACAIQPATELQSDRQQHLLPLPSAGGLVHMVGTSRIDAPPPFAVVPAVCRLRRPVHGPLDDFPTPLTLQGGETTHSGSQEAMTSQDRQWSGGQSCTGRTTHSTVRETECREQEILSS